MMLPNMWKPFGWPFAAGSSGGGPPAYLLSTTTIAGWGGKLPNVNTLYPTLRPSDNIDVPVQRIGHLADGTATVYTDNIRVTQRLREKYPNQTTLTTDDVVFAEYIRQGDILPVGMTNISTKQYPNGQTCWLQHDFFAIPMTGTFSVDLVVQHPFARNGRPVAAVDIIASDGTTTRTVRVNTLTFTTYATTGLGVDAFRATFTATDFIEAAEVTINAIIYPWRGPSYNLLTQGNAAPNMKNTVIRGYRVTPIYAHVLVGGSATPTASADPAVAAANPFGNVLAALTAIATVTGRSECGGGVVRFPNTVWSYDKTSLTGVALNTACVTFESINPSDKATTIIENTAGTVPSTNLPNRIVVRNMTLRKNGDAAALFRGWNTHERTYIFNNCTFDRNGQTYRTYWINHMGRLWVINCDEVGGSSGVMQANSTDVKNSVSFGSSVAGNCAITRIACKVPAVGCTTRVNVNLGFGQGMHVNNFISGNINTGFIVTFEVLTFNPAAGGYAFNMNVVERFADSGGAVYIFADNDTSHVEDFMFCFNTIPGGAVGNPNNDDVRINSMYSDVATATPPKHMYFRGNIFGRNARKTDTFIVNTTTGPNGNWPVVMGVDHALNTTVEGVNAPNSLPFWGPDGWRFQTIYDRFQIGDGGSGYIIPNYVNDQCRTGGGGGNGDYRLNPASPIQKVPAGWAITARDMLGRVIPDDGSAFIGALPAAA